MTGQKTNWAWGCVGGTVRRSGSLHTALRLVVPEPWASVGFGSALLTMTFALFPLLGRTPPAWRWPADVMATCLATHAVYVGTVAAVDDVLCRKGGI